MCPWACVYPTYLCWVVLALSGEPSIPFLQLDRGMVLVQFFKRIQNPVQFMFDGCAEFGYLSFGLEILSII